VLYIILFHQGFLDGAIKKLHDFSYNNP